jgi:guanine deaminase
MALQKYQFFKASILNPQNDMSCDYIEEGLLVTRGTGRNSRILDVLPLATGLKKYSARMTSLNTKSFKNSVIMPGFYDMHFHWVQDDVRQMPKDSLLGWLEKYTFPAETKFSQKSYAQKKAKEFFKKLEKSGTIGGACYSSIHEHAIEAAMGKVTGDFVIGNVIMNMNSPTELTQTEEDSLKLTKKLIRKFKTRHAFTPRFAITTTPKVMTEGSRLADAANCFKQTHLSETPQEIDFVLSLYKKLPGFKKVQSYTEIYQKTGMLGPRSLMGHGIHLADKELRILSKTKTSVIHCPTSNAPIEEDGLGSGLFDFQKIEKAKVRWALGSDIGGGPFLSMFDVMRSFVEQNERHKVSGATFTKALFRATLAGADILGLSKRSGNLNPGKEPNFIVVPFEGKSETGEDVLRSLISRHAHDRQAYESMVKYVYYRGARIS